MDRETNHKIRKRFNDGIYNVARYTEIMLSIVILDSHCTGRTSADHEYF